MTSRKCWHRPEKICSCTDDRDCIEVAFSYAQLVHCNDKDCFFNLETPYEFVPNKGIGYVPFADDIISGICTRKDLVLSPVKMWELKTNKKLTTCRMRADKNLKRPKFPDADKLEGGSYPDPIDPHAAYGVRN